MLLKKERRICKKKYYSGQNIDAFIKDNKKGAIVGAVLDGKLLTEAETKALAELPTKEELFAKMLGSINSTASGIANSINAVLSQLTRAMAALRDQKAAYFRCNFI